MREKIHIDKFVFGGQGLGRLSNGKVAFVWNAIPGEDVLFEPVKNKKEYVEGIATDILAPSLHRIPPAEPSFLSTSPWQIIDFSYEQEVKQAIAAETYAKIGDLVIHPSDISIDSDGRMFGYRNKMEFSFAFGHDGRPALAFFERGKKVKIPVLDSALANPAINEAAQKILAWIEGQQIPLRSLKSLIVRSARSTDSPKDATIAALFLKDRLPFSQFPSLDTHFAGFQLYYSTHKSPASVPTELLFAQGQDTLTQSLLGTPLQFGILSFFQVNPPLFERALQDIAAFLEPRTPIVDLYSGVGAISLPLSRHRLEAILADNSEEAIFYAKKNIAMNGLSQCSALCVPAENMTDAIASEKVLLVDPPRAGLHEKVIRAILSQKPTRVIYLSCDIATQARDMRLLSECYVVSFLKLYNFFPRTPHIEGLCVLDLL
ncbi:MAG TPA: hypothetical protein DCY48_00795 [Candidatus Magasanikbacteria bacterium]|nr:MAG: hypothetical protein A3I74_02375 [Candidatus Magasanikbacteria bacterium RIFCSPLOWO2_02_FULL_47_16]OGH79646.1 MAG: hypothetical protein A3C10_01025 [Candidatus Magasanikbacteria bacterium RIFCSPHIGHO2_02_FULL_48_18]HAZ28298.1 hypothetical protein [Candidatus Magasanikbacteria bacterium]